MSYKNNIIISVIFNFFFLSIEFILYFIYQFEGNAIELSKFIVFSHLLVIYLFAYRDFGFFSVYSFFLFCLYFFVYNSLVLDLLNYPGRENFAIIFFPAVHKFSDDVSSLFLLYTGGFFCLLDILYRILINFEGKKKAYNYIVDKRELFINNFAISGMILFLPISLYKMLRITLYIRKIGYVNAIVNGIPDNIFPFWANGSAGIIYALFFLALMFPVSKKRFFLASSLHIVNCLVKGFSGGRGAFFYEFFAVFLVYLSFYGTKRIKLKYISLLGFICVFFAIYIGNTRDSSNKQLSLKNNVLIAFLAGQTASRAVPLTVIEGDIPYHSYPFIFQPIFVSQMNPKEGRMNIIKNKNSIDLLTSYKHNRKRTLKGAGLGGSILAEFIDCGKWIGLIFWTLILAIMLCRLDLFNYTKRLLRPWSYILLVNIIHSPRGYFFKFIPKLKYVFIALFIYFIVDFFYNTFWKRGKNAK